MFISNIFKYLKYVFLLILFINSVYSISIIPQEKGFGIESSFARGGNIYFVSNLNNAGEGSLRACVEAKNPRICVFEISGTISLLSDLKILNPNLWIAGQTAPSPGITLKGAGFDIQASDILIQHLRIRPGDVLLGTYYDDRDAISLGSNYGHIKNIVIDHVSASWAIDENLGIWSYGGSVKEVSIINSIFSEALYDSLHSKGPHSMGALIGKNVENLLYSKNILAFNNYRNPLIRDDITNIIVTNNYIHNPGIGSKSKIYIGTKGDKNIPLRASIIGNLFYPNKNEYYYNSIYIEPDSASDLKVYVKDNLGPLYNPSDEWAIVYGRKDNSIVANSPPISISGLNILKANEIKNFLMENSGARPQDRDLVDKRIISNIFSGNGGIINSQNEVGGWPNLNINKRKFIVPANPHLDSNGDGYTNLEKFIHLYSNWVENDISIHPQLYLDIRNNYSSFKLKNEFNMSNSIPSSFKDLDMLDLSDENFENNLAILHDEEFVYIFANINQVKLVNNNEFENYSFNFIFEIGKEIKSISMNKDLSYLSTKCIENTCSSWDLDLDLIKITDKHLLNFFEDYSKDFLKIKIPINKLSETFDLPKVFGFNVNFTYKIGNNIKENTWSDLGFNSFKMPEGFGTIYLINNEFEFNNEDIYLIDNKAPVILNYTLNYSNNLETFDAKLNILTDELAYCKYDFNPSIHYLDMKNIFKNTLSINHDIFFKDLQYSQNYIIYIKCKDLSENINYNKLDYIIEFRVNKTNSAPVVEEPVIEEPVVEEPVIEEPVVEEPVVEEPVIEEPVIEEPVVEEPVVEEPVVEEPVIEEPVVEEPVVEEPVINIPSSGGGSGGGSSSSSNSIEINEDSNSEIEISLKVENNTIKPLIDENILESPKASKILDSCIPSYIYEMWSECKFGERERLVRDINNCEEDILERSFCDINLGESENFFLNSKEIELEKDEKNNLYIVQLDTKYNEVFKSKNKLINNKKKNDADEIVLIYDEITNQYFSARLAEYNEEEMIYYYVLERVDTNSIKDLKNANILEKTISDIIEEKKTNILNNEYFILSLRIITFLILFKLALVVGIYIRRHHRYHFRTNLHLHHFHRKNN